MARNGLPAAPRCEDAVGPTQRIRLAWATDRPRKTCRGEAENPDREARVSRYRTAQ